MEQDTNQEPLKDALAEIGQAIRTERQARGWSLRALAERASVSASLLSAVENGKIVPTVASLFAVAAAFGIPPQQLFPRSWREEPAGGRDPRSDSAALAQGAPAGGPSVSVPRERTEPRRGSERGSGVAEEAAISRGRSVGSSAFAAARHRSRARPASLPRRVVPGGEGVGVTSAVRGSESGSVPAENRSVQWTGAATPVSARDGRGRSAQATDDAGNPHVGRSARGHGAGDANWVLRSSERRSLEVMGGLRMVQVLARELPGVGMLELELDPGASSGTEMLRHSGEDIGLVVAGKVVIERGFERAVAGPGDCIRLDGAYPHRLSNEGDVTARLVWITLGPAGPRP